MRSVSLQSKSALLRVSTSAQGMRVFCQPKPAASRPLQVRCRRRRRIPDLQRDAILRAGRTIGNVRPRPSGERRRVRAARRRVLVGDAPAGRAATAARCCGSRSRPPCCRPATPRPPVAPAGSGASGGGDSTHEIVEHGAHRRGRSRRPACCPPAPGLAGSDRGRREAAGHQVVDRDAGVVPLLRSVQTTRSAATSGPSYAPGAGVSGQVSLLAQCRWRRFGPRRCASLATRLPGRTRRLRLVGRMLDAPGTLVARSDRRRKCRRAPGGRGSPSRPRAARRCAALPAGRARAQMMKSRRVREIVGIDMGLEPRVSSGSRRGGRPRPPI